METRILHERQLDRIRSLSAQLDKTRATFEKPNRSFRYKTKITDERSNDEVLRVSITRTCGGEHDLAWMQRLESLHDLKKLVCWMLECAAMEREVQQKLIWSF